MRRSTSRICSKDINKWNRSPSGRKIHNLLLLDLCTTVRNVENCRIAQDKVDCQKMETVLWHISKWLANQSPFCKAHKGTVEVLSQYIILPFYHIQCIYLDNPNSFICSYTTFSQVFLGLPQAHSRNLHLSTCHHHPSSIYKSMSLALFSLSPTPSIRHFLSSRST